MPNFLTLTDIANMAIDWCGGALSIQDIDDQNNPDAIVCKRNLPQAIKTEFDKYEWAFARRNIPAVLDTDESHAMLGYYCYELPDDFSRLSMYTFFDQMFPPVNQYQYGHGYLVQEGRLYTKWPISRLAYVSNNVPISEWHSLFADCVALNLAQRICGKMKGLDADISFYSALYREKLKDARRLELIGTEATQVGASVLQYNRIVP